MRHLITELLRYVTKCEDELNNTLVDELLKHGFDKSITQLEHDLETTTNQEQQEKQRVHIAPSNFNEMLNFLDTYEQNDLSFDLTNELESCLEKLKTDANAILAATLCVQSGKQSIETITDEKLSSLKRQLINETRLKNDLNVQLLEMQSYVDSFERDREQLEKQNELLLEKQRLLEIDLGKAHEKIAELIEHKEIVSEGYGEKLTTNRRESRVSFFELQERARALIAEWDLDADNPILILLEDLCKEGDKITEEARRDHEDLIQQVGFFYCLIQSA